MEYDVEKDMVATGSAVNGFWVAVVNVLFRFGL